MGCTEIHFDVAVVDYASIPVEEPATVNLLKTNIVHIINEDPCTAPLEICIKRVVKCQKGCYFDRLLHDFPVDDCDPILPPGEYEITVPEKELLLETGVVSLNVVFEEVTPEYVQAIIANKLGGCS